MKCRKCNKKKDTRPVHFAGEVVPLCTSCEIKFDKTLVLQEIPDLSRWLDDT